MDTNSDVATAVESTVIPTTHVWCPPEIHEAIYLCREFLKDKIVYTGRTLNANTFARILPLYQGFVESNLSFFADKFGYIPVAKPGAKGQMFAIFRDQILPPALRMLHVHSDVDNFEQTRHIKRDVKNNGMCSARCIVGWEFVARS